jgi:hypothetical protein
MSRAVQEKFILDTSSNGCSAHTLLLRMTDNADKEGRAERIRQLKEDHPELRWQAIADHVGVTLRAAQAWPKTGAIAYPNAKRLAELFHEIDVDYIMRGARPAADPESTQLDRIEAKLDQLLGLQFEQELADAVEQEEPQESESEEDDDESAETGTD